jgi:hypothetical protein
MEMEHSRKGIASFVLSIIPLLLTLLMLIGDCYRNTWRVTDFLYTHLILGYVAMVIMPLNAVAFGLGVAGVLDKDRKPIFAVLGIVLCWLMFYGMYLLSLLTTYPYV